MKKSAWIWLAAAALAVQAAGLGWLIARYERVVTKGTEVRIPCGAFDPVDVLRGRYLHVNAGLECRDDEAGALVKGLSWHEHAVLCRKMRAKLEPEKNEAGTWRLVRVALEPDGEGLWVKPSNCFVRGERADQEPEIWNTLVGFPGKLFMDEQLAKAADRVFARREGEAVAVYRAWKGEMVITDVEIDGVSVKELARRARAAEKAGTWKSRRGFGWRRRRWRCRGLGWDGWSPGTSW